MAKRWLIGGLAVGVGALVVTPEARTWLRRRLGLEAEDRRWFEEESAEAPEYEGDEPLDTREARFSLRARLSEEAPAEQEAELAPELAEAPAPEPEPVPAEATPEPAPFGAAATPEPLADPFATPPEPTVEAAPEPTPAAAPWPATEPARAPEPESTPFSPPARDVGYPPFESVPAIRPEGDAPKTPGEDTDEVGPLPPVDAWEAPAAAPPLPPPTELRPPAPPPSRPFSSESSSFRSAIDAARERVHGAAREATPDSGESTEPIDEDEKN
jgi:hypothetical protein